MASCGHYGSSTTAAAVDETPSCTAAGVLQQRFIAAMAAVDEPQYLRQMWSCIAAAFCYLPLQVCLRYLWQSDLLAIRNNKRRCSTRSAAVDKEETLVYYGCHSRGLRHPCVLRRRKQQALMRRNISPFIRSPIFI